MNWLLISVVVFLGVFLIRGYSNGLIKTVFSVFAVLIALILAVTISPYVSKALQGNERVFGFVEAKVAASATLLKGKAEGIPGTSETEGTPGILDTEGAGLLGTEMLGTEQTNMINQLSLPKSLKNELIKNNNPEVYKLFKVDNFQSYITNYIACIILNAISFAMVFLIGLIGIRILANTLDGVSKLPIINEMNKIGGGLIGFIYGLLILWVLCIVLTALSSTGIGVAVFGYINSSRLLTLIYDNNVLLSAVTNIAKMFF